MSFNISYRQPEAIRQMLIQWLNTPSIRGQRRFLETHLELLDLHCEELLNKLAMQFADQPERVDVLKQRMRLLQDVRKDGGTKEAIHEAYVNEYGGFSLDLPSWLEAIENQHAQNGLQLHNILARAELDRSIAPEIKAAIRCELASILNHDRSEERAQALDKAIVLWEASLQEYTFARYPRQWAMIQNNLGVAYIDRIIGDPQENQEESIRCLTAALQIYTLGNFPVDFAGVQINLGTAYAQRIKENRQHNEEKAIQCFTSAKQVYTLTDYPREHADTLNNLGGVYLNRSGGSRRDNLERAIQYFNAALQVPALAESPVDFAKTQSNLANAYLDRIAGSRRDNQEQAILYYTSALQITPLTNFPIEHTIIQNNLGTAYSQRITGNKSDNLERAIRCFMIALQIFLQINIPSENARTHLNLARAYIDRIAGSRRDNLEASIRCCSTASLVYTRTDYPVQYAMLQHNLGSAYLERIEGDGQTNLEMAIECFTAALQVRTLTDEPRFYAESMNNLGAAYFHRIVGNQQENLQEAVRCYDAAMQVYTLSEFPIEHRDVQLNIAMAWLAFTDSVSTTEGYDDTSGIRAGYERAHNAFASARQSQNELNWFESDEQGHALLQASNVLTKEMYAHDAWCLWQLGDLRGAVVALEEGRARALVESQIILEATIDHLCQKHRATFVEVRQRLQEARVEDNHAHIRAARDDFLQMRQEIRTHCQHTFLPDAPSYQDIVCAAAPEQAILYLTTIDKGGLALVVPPAQDQADFMSRKLVAISLPRLTKRKVAEWFFRSDDQGNLVGGYLIALQDRFRGSGLLKWWAASRDNPQERALRKVLPLCDLVDALPPTMSTLGNALTNLITSWRAEANYLSGLDTPHQEMARVIRQQPALSLEEARAKNSILGDLDWYFQQAELDYLLNDMYYIFMKDLRYELDACGLGNPDQPIALVPSGQMGILPIHAVWARQNTASGEYIPFYETCELTLQASARSLATARASLVELPAGPMIAFGDPAFPQNFSLPQLPWAEAEAQAAAALAHLYGREGSKAIIGHSATLSRILSELRFIREKRSGAIIDLATHGRADPSNPTHCYMLLAGDERLMLADLQRERLLEGTRLFSASGCVTGLGDAEDAPDELGSFAAGILQAGSPCAVATLWPVSDRAMFLLMLLFLGGVFKGESPARAMRSAAYWMRTATRSQIEALALQGLKGLPSTLAESDLAGEALRGIIPLGSETDTTRMTMQEAFIRLQTVSHLHTEDAAPFHSAIYWASSVVYGV